MRYALLLLCLLLVPVGATYAQLSIGIGVPGLSIGINLGGYPELVRVPGYPVYYAPRLNSNFFFYDGMYWVYQNDNWYASSWYNGPWGLVGREVVPLFVLRIPVRYYRNPPGYFRGWRTDAPPRWGEHWGNDWQQRRSGWDQWNRNAVPTPAPLPVYQRQYAGNRYPQQDQQRNLQTQNYRYQPRDAVVQQHYQEQAERHPQGPNSERGQQGAPQNRDSRPQDVQRPSQPQQPPVSRPQQRGGEDAQRSTQPPAQREQQPSRPNQENAQHGKGASNDERQGKGQDKGQDRSQDRGQDKGQDKGRDRGDERGPDRNR